MVSNVISVVIVLGAMFFLSWQITLVALIMLPVFVLPARWVGRKLSGDHAARATRSNAEMNTTMTERFNVSGALLVKLFGRPDDESADASRAGRAGCATSASCRRCTAGCSSPR